MKQIPKKTSRKVIILAASIYAILLITFIGTSLGEDQENISDTNQTSNYTYTNNKTNDSVPVSKKVSICDGISITENCEYDSVEYAVYKYYPAIAEKSHTETRTTYTKEVTGYCTLCNDGTYSPSCATGRGACSHHGGVAQWNAPVYSNKPNYETIKIIDSAAVPERYEKIIKNN